MTRIAIIGRGPGGYEAALVAAQLGAEVTVVDRDGLGGACVLTDCVPSKTLIATSESMTMMADSPSLGVVNDACEVFGYEGLFCMDSSAIPTSLGVNPSLTISAVCERAAESLVLRAGDFGLPDPPPGHRFRKPSQIVGDRVRAKPNERRRRRKPKAKRKRAGKKKRGGR